MSIDLVEEIERGLPNGFHDSEITQVKLDYRERTVVFEMNVLVGDLESSNEAERERYREGVLTVSRFHFYVIEAPDLKYPFATSLTISSGSGNPMKAPSLENIPEHSFAHWFFVKEWNAFIYFVAGFARFEWAEHFSRR